jgi:hypothetical protein
LDVGAVCGGYWVWGVWMAVLVVLWGCLGGDCGGVVGGGSLVGWGWMYKLCLLVVCYYCCGSIAYWWYSHAVGKMMITKPFNWMIFSLAASNLNL